MIAAFVLYASMAGVAQTSDAKSTPPPASPCDKLVDAVATADADKRPDAIIKAAACLRENKDTAQQAQLMLARLQDRKTATATVSSILQNPNTTDATREAARTLLVELEKRPQILADESLALLKSEKMDAAKIAAAKSRCDAARADDAAHKAVGECTAAVERAALRLKVDADLAVAQKQLDTGLRTEAINLVKTTIPNADEEQRVRALTILDDARTVDWRNWTERFRAPWVADVLAGLAMALALFLGLLAFRRLGIAYQRWRSRRTRRPWTLQAIAEEGGQKFGSADVVLDALRRIPVEVKRDMWQPTSLLLPPIDYKDFYADVWEDFYVAPGQALCHISEGLHPMTVDGERQARDDFFAAFQNVQITTAVPVFPLLRLVKSAYDWFSAGGPAFSSLVVSRLVGQKQEMAVRLSASDRLYGDYRSVMASTEVASGADALGLSAERAAYKLLYRLSHPETPMTQIEGRAALRQGLSLLSSIARDQNGSAQDRKIALEKAVSNLDFASQTLHGDGAEPPWPECLRFKAVASFLLKDLPGAMQALKRIEDTRKCSDAKRARTLVALQLEARHNLAVVLTRMGSFPNLQVAVSLFGQCLPDEPALPGDGLTLSAHLGRLAAFAAFSRSEWDALEAQSSEEALVDSWKALQSCRDLSLTLAADNRIKEFAVCEAGRMFGIAWSRFLFSQRGGDHRIPILSASRMTLVTEAQTALHTWTRSREATVPDLVALSHLALMAGANTVAREFALKAISLDSKNEFAHYLAVEALFRQNDMSGAAKQAALFKDPVTETVFLELRANIASALAPTGAPNPLLG